MIVRQGEFLSARATRACMRISTRKGLLKRAFDDGTLNQLSSLHLLLFSRLSCVFCNNLQFFVSFNLHQKLLLCVCVWSDRQYVDVINHILHIYSLLFFLLNWIQGLWTAVIFFLHVNGLKTLAINTVRSYTQICMKTWRSTYLFYFTLAPFIERILTHIYCFFSSRHDICGKRDHNKSQIFLKVFQRSSIISN